MGRYSCSGLLLLVLLLPAAAAEFEASVNGEERLTVVESGTSVEFVAVVPANASVIPESFKWDFGRNLTGNGSRYNDSASVTQVLHAAGAYSVTCTATYGDGSSEQKQLWVIVSWEEAADEPDTHRPLFVALAGAELFMSGWLLWQTWRLKEAKVYL